MRLAVGGGRFSPTDTCKTHREHPEEMTGVLSCLVWLVGHHATARLEFSMDDLDDDTLMGLAEFRKLLHLSPSGERRLRGEQQDWPPTCLWAGRSSISGMVSGNF